MENPGKPQRLYERIYTIVRQIPLGKVTTYGQVARMVPGVTARMVGYAMAATPQGSEIPWQRVINAQGKISPHGYGFGSALQRQILLDEGIMFDALERIDLSGFGWPDGIW